MSLSLHKEKNRKLIFFSILIISLSFFVSLLSLSLGVYEIDFRKTFSILLFNSYESSVSNSIILDIRLPRIILSFFVGVALAISGAVMQGLFRNPLADPAILGVSAGAA